MRVPEHNVAYRIVSKNSSLLLITRLRLFVSVERVRTLKRTQRVEQIVNTVLPGLALTRQKQSREANKLIQGRDIANSSQLLRARFDGWKVHSSDGAHQNLLKLIDLLHLRRSLPLGQSGDIRTVLFQLL